ncbi:MAG TPA: hypothetical protein VF263_08955, partial [Longimicrobiaceae bacterium]
MIRPRLLAAPLAALLALCAAPALHAQTPIVAGEEVLSDILVNAPLLEGRFPGKEYLYRAEAGEYLVITLEADSFDPVLFWGKNEGDPPTFSHRNNNGLGTGNGRHSKLEVQVQEAGEYRIRVMMTDSRDLGGSFALKVERGTPPARTTAVTKEMDAAYNDFDELAVTDAFDQEAPYDHYTYRGPAGKPVMITMRSSDMQPALLWGEMRGGEFRLLEEDEGSAGDDDARLLVTPAPGTVYAVRATTNTRGETGKYVLSGTAVRTLGPGDAAFTGPPLTRVHNGKWMFKADIRVDGPAIGGYLAPLVSEGTELGGWYYERYRYQAQGGERLRLTLTSDHVDSFLTVDAVIGGTDHLRTGATLRRIAHDDNGAGAAHSRIELTFPEAGQYI